MSAQTIIGPISGLGSGVFPSLIFVQGTEQRTLYLDHSPFSVGRKMEKDLVIADPRVSRDHAIIVSESGKFFVEDQGSKHGTFVNGERIQRQILERNDRLEFGARDTIYAVFHPQHVTTNTARDFLSQISGIQISNEVTDLEKLTIFLEAARKLNTTGVLDEILLTLLDVTLKLTGSERGYVFLKNLDGKLRLAAGRNSKGELLLDDTTISHSILEDALRSNSEFLLTDTSQSLDLSGRQSIVAYDLRTVICIPLRKMQVQTRARGISDPASSGDAMGALYVDSRFASRDISKVSGDILHVVATEAASLIENARLVQAEEDLAIVLADVAGKGVSAALLASTLQGMMYSQLVARMPLTEIVASANRFLTSKRIGEKYATVIIARLRHDGELEYVNCGHIPPLLVCGGEIIRPSHGNLPVGLLPDATYESDRYSLHAGDRLVLVTDGVTEAENAEGEFFDNERLEIAAKKGTMQDIFAAVSDFCGSTPLNDDCTVVEMVFSGE